MNEEQLTNNQTVAELVTEEEWSSWKQHPTTKIFREFLKKRLRDVQDGWMRGAYTSPEGDQTLQLNSRAVGESQTLNTLLELSAEDVNEGMRNE